MSLKRLLTECLLSIGVLGTVTADTLRIESQSLQIHYDTASRQLTLSDADSGKPFALIPSFSCADTTVHTGDIKDAHFGSGKALILTLPDGSTQQVALFPNLPFALFQKTLRGTPNSQAINRVSYPPLTLRLGQPLDALTTLGTGGLLKPADNPGSYMWCAVADPTSRCGVVSGWITTARGSGIVRITTQDQCVQLLPHVDYGRLLIEKNKQEPLEQFAVGFFRDARLGLEAYADAIAKYHAIKLPPMPTVHCTWYVDGSSDEHTLSNRTVYVAQALKSFGLNVMQIDDGWQLGQSTNGPKKIYAHYNPKGPYPSGMQPIADTINAAGMTAGIWLTPFAGSCEDPWFADKMHWFAKRPDGSPYDTRWGGTCLDLTHPETQDYLRQVINTMTHQWGYHYLKMDALYAGAAINLNYVCDTFREDEIGQAILSDPSVTQIQMMRNSLRLVREAAGKDVFILGCCTPQNMRSAGAAFGLVDAMRIGPDNGASWSHMMRGPEFGAWNYFLNGRVWYNDPDPLYVRASLPASQAQALVSWVTLSGQMNSSSEHYDKLPPDRLDMLKRSMPSHHATARPVDLFENRIPGIWQVTDQLEGKRRDVIGLFNWESSDKTCFVTAKTLDIPHAEKYIAFEYWGNTLTPPFTHTLAYPVKAQSCAVLAVCAVANHPQLISTSRHITQGLVDVKRAHWHAASRTLEGTSETVAGDRYELRILTYTGENKPAYDNPIRVVLTGANGHELTITPGEGSVTRPDDAYNTPNTPSAPMTTLFEPQREEGLVRVSFISGSSGRVTWRVIFAEQPAPALIPTVQNLKANMSDAYSPVDLTWQSNTRFCEIWRDGKLLVSNATSDTWQDKQIASEKTYRYEVIPYTLDHSRGAPQVLTFSVPKIPKLGPIPPKPDIPVDTLNPLKTVVGWGSFKRGTSLNGPLRLGQETYKSGVCIHADGKATYTRDPSWHRFVAIVGIDESQRPQAQSSIIFSVAVEAPDGCRILASSPVIRFGQQERWHFNVELPKDAERIILQSESAGDGNKSDHGNWCDAGFCR